MRYDIAITNRKYRGMERAVTATDLLNPKTEKQYDVVLEKYFSYLEYADKVDEISFEKTVAYYLELRQYDIPCELIAYGSIPVENIFGYSTELLGIDIVHDMCESLICDELNPEIVHLLNENGLCENVEDVEKIIPFQDYGGVEWKPCYVYKVILLDEMKQKG